jgi:PAS domain S-box-containing protein
LPLWLTLFFPLSRLKKSYGTHRFCGSPPFAQLHAFVETGAALFSNLSVPREHDLLFRAVIDSAPDGIVLFNQLGRIVLVDVQTEKLLECARAELVDQPIEILVPDRFRGRHRGHRAGYLSSRQLRPVGFGADFFGLRKDGTEFPVEISLCAANGEGEALVVSAIYDITERKRVEKRSAAF